MHSYRERIADERMSLEKGRKGHLLGPVPEVYVPDWFERALLAVLHCYSAEALHAESSQPGSECCLLGPRQVGK